MSKIISDYKHSLSNWIFMLALMKNRTPLEYDSINWALVADPVS